MSGDVFPPLRHRLPLPLPVPPSLTRGHSASPNSRAGSRRSPEVTSTATEERNDGGVDNEVDQELDDFEEKAFFVLGKTTRPRNWCITVVMWPYPLHFVLGATIRETHFAAHRTFFSLSNHEKFNRGDDTVLQIDTASFAVFDFGNCTLLQEGLH